MGIGWEPEPTEDLTGICASMQGLVHGHAPKTFNVLRGTWRGRQVRLFALEFTVGGGRNRRTVRKKVALAPLPDAWPFLSIRPETLGDKLADALGADDIDFESQEFSNRFWVKSEDRRFAYDLIHPRMMQFLLGPGWQEWQVRGAFLALWTEGPLEAADVQPALERLIGFLDLWPPHVVGQRREAEAVQA